MIGKVRVKSLKKIKRYKLCEARRQLMIPKSGDKSRSGIPLRIEKQRAGSGK